MGLGAYRTAWKRQSRYFGHTHPEFSSLVFDNRGVGLSDKPTCRYSTSEMAKDIVDLLVGVGWLNEDLSLPDPRNKPNVVGVSMGGMIAQELALALPSGTLNSLFLISTWPRVVRTVPFLENLKQRVNMFIPRDIDVQLDGISDRLFSDDFLKLPDTEGDEPYGPGGPNYPTNRDRYCAGEMEKRQDTVGFPKKAFFLQAIAAGWHYKSTAQIHEMRDRVGKGRVAVTHGTKDNMITYNHGELLRDEIGEGVEWKSYDDRGHVLMWEEEKSFNQWVSDFIQKCKTMES
jgi:pimeloyl-ACP methyl ester carboxylesterase